MADEPLPTTPLPSVPPVSLAPALQISRVRLAMAFGVAALADGLTLGLGWAPPMWLGEVGLDIVVGLALWWILGRRWWLLIPLVLEALPVVAMFPTWLAVMGVIAATGGLGRKKEAQSPAAGSSQLG